MDKFSLDRDWKFYNGDFELPETKTHTECYMAAKAGGAIGAASPDFDKSDWETVNLPHDWAVYNEFEEKWGPSQGYKKRGKAWYSKRFRLDESDRDKQILIEFEGISSYATVYLNGSVIGRNFCGYNSFVVDATDMALYGDQVNDLVVFVDATQIEGWWYEGAGIYRHVNLYKKNKLHIAHWGVFVHPIRKTVDVWDAATDTTIENSSYENKNFRLKTYILDKEDNIVGKDEKEFSVAGGNKIEVNQSILTYSPLLWDIDAPNLYTMVSELYENDSLVDSQKNTFGFRTIAINKDNGFFLNGRHVPLYGTCNHQDHAGVGVAVPDSVNEYRIKLLKEMGSNAYRCAHGNPNPEILDYCDKYGILVWQDMMFACGMFPADEHYLNSVAEEVKDNVKRLRNHPCIALWNGNNENEISYFGWGWKDRYTSEEDRIYQSNLHKLFYDVIPEAIQAVDETRYYHPTSPVTGYNNIDYNMGDVHFWSVWKGGWLEEYTEAKNIGRFMSEYGFQSYPEMRTIRRFASEHDLRLDSEVMLSHQRARNDQTRDPNFGNNMMKMYMEKYFKVPDDFSEFVYMSQYLQAEAVKIGIEAHRRAKSYCMGTLYWQINDCWPVASWSSIDYYGNWKALHYQAKRAFAPVLINPIQQNDSLSVYLISDRLDTMEQMTLEMKVVDFDGKTLGKKIQVHSLEVPANTSKCVYRAKLDGWLTPEDCRRSFLKLILKDKSGHQVAESVHFFRKTKDLQLPPISVSYQMKQTDGKCELTLFSSMLAKDIFIETPLQGARYSDNFFDLLPGERKKVIITSPRIKKGEELPVNIKHIRETYK